MDRKTPDKNGSLKLTKNVDYYIDAEGNYVFTARYLERRGRCCKNGCRHCPYGFKKKKQ